LGCGGGGGVGKNKKKRAKTKTGGSLGDGEISEKKNNCTKLALKDY